MKERELKLTWTDATAKERPICHTAIYKNTGEFVCWYWTDAGTEIVKNLDPCNITYDLVDLTDDQIKTLGLPLPPGEIK